MGCHVAHVTTITFGKYSPTPFVPLSHTYFSSSVTRNCVSVFRRRIEEVKVMGEFKIKLMERRK